MNSIGGLRTALLDLLQRLEGSDVTLIIGGGFGILLKIEHVQKSRARTLLNAWPEPRSTNDIDLFLRPELLINSYKVKPLADAISDLGYKVVEGAEKYQFVKPGPTGGRAGSLKLDILTGPRSSFAGTGLRTDERRVRPNPSVGLHAHPVDEVPTLEENLLTVSVAGKLSSGEIREDEVLLPHPFSFLMMKLFALHDRLDDKEKDFARYHALDIYAIAAATTENEWESALAMRNRHRDHPFVIRAAELAYDYFSQRTSRGMIRLRESQYYRADFQIDEFTSALLELFPRRGQG